ncbi:MAG: biopolymer transporter ExbD [Gemmataceae bacterium]|nr:biopolymer transporter ExbD [Gemmataceae bacterium]
MTKQKLLDVWIVETNSVYRDVPFTVVADWIQQGRLLLDDRVRLAGQDPWRHIAKVSAFAPYLPQPEPLAAEDQAEALQEVDLGLDWGHRTEEEDEDVDMIPLIDISLVLLIFFMMTATVASSALSPIDTPAAKRQLATVSAEQFWLGIDLRDPAGQIEKGAGGRTVPWYSAGKDRDTTVPTTRDLNETLAGLAQTWKEAEGEVRVRLRADKSLPIETVRNVQLRLQELEAGIRRTRGPSGASFTLTVLGEVSEPE